MRAITWGGAKKQHPKVASQIICILEGIDSVAKLLKYYKGEKLRIKSKRGKKTHFENKVIKLKNYKLNSFLKHCDGIEAL